MVVSPLLRALSALISAAKDEQQKSSPSQLESIKHLIRQLRESQAELEKSNNEKEYLKDKLQKATCVSTIIMEPLRTLHKN